MTITEEQFQRIEHCFPTQRGNVKLSNLNVLTAILYVAENGCKWRALPKRFGRWHTVYTRMNRWAKAGVLDRVFTALQEEEVMRIKVEALGLKAGGEQTAGPPPARRPTHSSAWKESGRRSWSGPR